MSSRLPQAAKKAERAGKAARKAARVAKKAAKVARREEKARQEKARAARHATCLRSPPVLRMGVACMLLSDVRCH